MTSTIPPMPERKHKLTRRYDGLDDKITKHGLDKRERPHRATL